MLFGDVVIPNINFPLLKSPSLFFPLRQNVLFGESIIKAHFFQNCEQYSSRESLIFKTKMLVQSLLLPCLVYF